MKPLTSEEWAVICAALESVQHPHIQSVDMDKLRKTANANRLLAIRREVVNGR